MMDGRDWKRKTRLIDRIPYHTYRTYRTVRTTVSGRHSNNTRLAVLADGCDWRDRTKADDASPVRSQSHVIFFSDSTSY